MLEKEMAIPAEVSKEWVKRVGLDMRSVGRLGRAKNHID